MNIQTQEELLLFLLVPYINNELGTQFTKSDLSIKYTDNDQNSRIAFHIFSNDVYHAFNIYVYLQYTLNTSFSDIHFENMRKLTNGIYVSFTLDNTELDFYLNGSAQIGLLLSMETGNEFFNLPPGNILPLDYQISDIITNENNVYDILLLDDNDPLLINGSAILLKGV